MQAIVVLVSTFAVMCYGLADMCSHALQSRPHTAACPLRLSGKSFEQIAACVPVSTAHSFLTAYCVCAVLPFAYHSLGIVGEDSVLVLYVKF